MSEEWVKRIIVLIGLSLVFLAGAWAGRWDNEAKWHDREQAQIQEARDLETHNKAADNFNGVDSIDNHCAPEIDKPGEYEIVCDDAPTRQP